MVTATEIKWVEAKCPECGQKYKYPEGGYEPSTCENFDCVHKHLHPELSRVNPVK